MKYIVIELQTSDDGTVGNFVWAFDERNKAESKYHAVLAVAAVSEIPIHAASLLQNDGRLLNCASYDHTPEPEPEPEGAGDSNE